MPDFIRPTWEQAYHDYREQCLSMGRGFNQNTATFAINAKFEANRWDFTPRPFVDNPEILPEDAARARAIRMEDATAIAEQKAAIDAAERARLTRESEDRAKDAELAALRAEIAALKSDMVVPPPDTTLSVPDFDGKPSALAAQGGPVAGVPDGKPMAETFENWTKAQLLEYAAAHGVSVEKPTFASKKTIYDAIAAAEAA